MNIIYTNISAYNNTLVIAAAVTGLFSIAGVILLYKIYGFLKQSAENVPASQAMPAYTPAAQPPIPNRQEFIAAVSAAIAEDMGKDISAIRILSVKRV